MGTERSEVPFSLAGWRLGDSLVSEQLVAGAVVICEDIHVPFFAVGRGVW